eukprot:1025878-Rhodomonas_salina.7
MGSLVEGARYLLLLEIRNNQQVIHRLAHEIKASGTASTPFPLELPPLLGGQYNLNLILTDTFPGLSEDDAFLAARAQQVDIQEPKSWADVSRKDITCIENVLWKSQLFDADDITLASVASIDRALAVLHLAQRWDGPMSITFYARTEEEESAISSFVEEDFGPFCDKKKMNLQVLL